MRENYKGYISDSMGRASKVEVGDLHGFDSVHSYRYVRSTAYLIAWSGLVGCEKLGEVQLRQSQSTLCMTRNPYLLSSNP